ncbi:hypothetical protein [Corynebacterium heidelbergense]|uniref:Uncharacterized protein n=1 Tax=Corynebacterium heidelbergense TaxID=2055947 RepID=A0A364V8E5_9CORY|nr:hypothetical protein [Corynebacterium heidelbergense]RAV32899.1 hypothetical protein DLJ54_01185 [Corynebacterium heidelbergense]
MSDELTAHVPDVHHAAEDAGRLAEALRARTTSQPAHLEFLALPGAEAFLTALAAARTHHGESLGHCANYYHRASTALRDFGASVDNQDHQAADALTSGGSF